LLHRIYPPRYELPRVISSLARIGE
jgi:hypothetical protein